MATTVLTPTQRELLKLFAYDHSEEFAQVCWLCCSRGCKIYSVWWSSFRDTENNWFSQSWSDNFRRNDERDYIILYKLRNALGRSFSFYKRWGHFILLRSFVRKDFIASVSWFSTISWSSPNWVRIFSNCWGV